MNKIKKWWNNFVFGKNINAKISNKDNNELNYKTLFPGIYWFFIKIKEKDNTIDKKLYDNIYNDILNVRQQKRFLVYLKINYLMIIRHEKQY